MLRDNGCCVRWLTVIGGCHAPVLGMTLKLPDPIHGRYYANLFIRSFNMRG
jgi:hypothetical protein